MKSSNPADNENRKTATGSYSAPALEKGLDILELLAASVTALSQLQIAKSLDRTATEIFRMLTVLERRGYLLRDNDGSYQLTLKLFDLAHRHPPTKMLLSVALPAMQQLAEDSRQSTHLVVHHQGRILVVAQVDSPEPLNFSVRLGAHFPLHPERTSARVLTAFTDGPAREPMVAQMARHAEGAISRVQLEAELAQIRADGYYQKPSQTTAGVVDVSSPIFDHTGAIVAAVTVPYLKQSNIKVGVQEVLEQTRATAQRISQGLGQIQEQNAC